MRTIKSLCFYICFFLFISSCGRDFHQENWPDMFKVMFSEYLSQAKYFDNAVSDDKAGNGTIAFYDDSHFDGDIIGVCFRWNNGDWEVHLKQSYWENASDYSRELIFFHELGHCLHDFNHRSEKKDDGYPLSIMNPYMFNGVYYNDNRYEYLDELYTGG